VNSPAPPRRAPQRGGELGPPDFVISIAAGLLALIGFFLLLRPTPETKSANIKYEKPKTFVEIMPIVAQVKQGKIIEHPGPNPLARKPSLAPKPSPEPQTVQPSTMPSHDPTQPRQKHDAGPPPPDHVQPDASGPPVPPQHDVVDAAVVAVSDASSTAPGTPGDAATGAGPQGVADGGTSGPPRGIVNRYRAMLAGWFVSRFRIKGMIPFATLKSLHGHAVAQMSGRSVTGFNVSGPSGNGTFDSQMNAALQSAVGQLVPKPPDEYPELLTPTIDLDFSCTVQAQCEDIP